MKEILRNLIARCVSPRLLGSVQLRTILEKKQIPGFSTYILPILLKLTLSVAYNDLLWYFTQTLALD